MYQNNLTNRYQSYLNQPISFINNQMLNNSPIYSSNINDQNFYQQMMLHREEQIRKIRNISEIGISKDKITEYVIAPIKVERSDMSEINKLIGEEEQLLTEEFVKNNWWSKRTNAPYKNIIKDQDFKKTFKTNEDLVVHRYTDSDRVGLMDEYKTLLKLIEKHNGDLKIIYSASKETEHKKAFRFVEKYRKRVKYNPKNYNDLKNYYNKEQRKFDRKQNRLDNLISKIMDEDMSEKELKQIEQEYITQTKEKAKKTKAKEKEIDRQLQELIDEFGEEVLKELEEEEEEKEEDINNNNEVCNKKEKNSLNNQNKKIKSKAKARIVRNKVVKTNKSKSASSPESSDPESSDKENKTTGEKRIRIKRTTTTEDPELKIKTKTKTKHEKSDGPKNGEVDTDAVKRIRIIRKKHAS
ncbi:mRNA export factor GLE1-like [Hydra vulgaris]|uniref:mRNA export factor GLE1-like n=1 Tax=Hydra vulgaris TaxID=6087 RepID=UPI0032EA0B69